MIRKCSLPLQPGDKFSKSGFSGPGNFEKKGQRKRVRQKIQENIRLEKYGYYAYNICMKDVNWNNEKNDWLRKERGISFEIVRYYIENGGYVDIIEHPLKERYPNQKIFVLDIEDYIYCVPFVESETEIFLKTIFPSRSFTKKYLNKEVSP
jgi:hypothetical protein